MQNRDYEQGLKYSLRLLKTRMYSEQKLAEKLAQRGIDPAASEAILHHLRDHRLLDDRAYTDSLIRSYARYRSASTQMIKYKLQQKGISKNLIEEGLHTQRENIPDEKERANELARKWMSRHSKNFEQDRLGAFLQRKGFAYGVIREVLDSFKK